MTTPMTKEALDKLRLKAERATKGEWWFDSIKNEGSYGLGDDCVEGFTSYAVYDENDRVLLDTLNSSAACIQEEYDGEGHVAWDEVGQRNAEFVAAANPATVLALLDALEHYQSREERVTKLVLDNDTSWEMLAEQVEAKDKRIEEVEKALRWLTESRASFAETSITNRVAFEEAEKRIAQQKEIIAKQEKWIKEVEETMIAATDRAESAEQVSADYRARLDRLEKRCDHKFSVYWDASGVKRCSRCGLGITLQIQEGE